MNRAFAFAAAVLVLVAAACVPIARKAECENADACDQAREDPFNSFPATDAQFGDLGTCWQNEETAKACVAECNAFLADELAIAQAANNIALIEACGG
ncbi:MAG: hypothetical protein Q8O67_21935 [Deltaproteobacteria bacterium]|nr:hypothetical protein [Deltaproteobacteria bacterium]